MHVAEQLVGEEGHLCGIIAGEEQRGCCRPNAFQLAQGGDGLCEFRIVGRVLLERVLARRANVLRFIFGYEFCQIRSIGSMFTCNGVRPGRFGA